MVNIPAPWSILDTYTIYTGFQQSSHKTSCRRKCVFLSCQGEMDSFDDTAMVRLDRNCRIAERSLWRSSGGSTSIILCQLWVFHGFPHLMSVYWRAANQKYMVFSFKRNVGRRVKNSTTEHADWKIFFLGSDITSKSIGMFPAKPCRRRAVHYWWSM